MKKLDHKIAIDFDGVIHKYSKSWQDGKIYDEPIDGSIEAIKKLQDLGYEVVIFTARAYSSEQVESIVEWLKRYGLEEIPEITNIKSNAVCYIDDRAIRFTDWSDMLKYFY